MKKHYLLGIFLLGSTTFYAQEIIKSSFGQTIVQNKVKNLEIINPEDNGDIVWEQDRSNATSEYSITSSHFDLAQWGTYVADDFELAGETTIDGIFFHGSQSDQNGASFINSVNIYFYEDVNGEPNGNPSEVGTAILEVKDIAIDSEFVEVAPGRQAFLGNKEYFIDIKGFLGESLVLPEGVYWISIVFNLELAQNDFNIRWSWNDSETENLKKAMIIDPTNGIGGGFTSWTFIDEVGFPVTDMAFTLYGETEVLSISTLDGNNISVFPNPTSDVLFISFANDITIESVSATSLLGQKQVLNIEDNKINISHLSSGIYVIQINTNKGAILKKVIRQ